MALDRKDSIFFWANSSPPTPFIFFMSSTVISDTEDLFAGILMLADKHEQYLRTSPNRLKDSVLETYLQDLTCKLAGNRCSDIRVYLLRSPSFNAFMMPNGAMFVYSG